jgi:hypothetical protein
VVRLTREVTPFEDTDELVLELMRLAYLSHGFEEPKKQTPRRRA